MTSTTHSGDIRDTLAARGAAYGDFREQGRITQNLKRAMHDSPNWARLPGYMKEGLDMIQHKVSRILNGDALYDDNIHDIIGYARLMQDRMAQDREAGVVFETGGDKLYPVYEQDVRSPSFLNGPVRAAFTSSMPPTDGRDFDERLASALRELNDLGFHLDGDLILNDKEEPPHKVLSDYVWGAAPKEIRDPAFFNDPIRAYFTMKDRGQGSDRKG